MAAAMRPQNASFKNQTMRAVLFRKEKNATQKASSEEPAAISPANKKDGIKAVLFRVS